MTSSDEYKPAQTLLGDDQGAPRLTLDGTRLPQAQGLALGTRVRVEGFGSVAEATDETDALGRPRRMLVVELRDVDIEPARGAPNYAAMGEKMYPSDDG